MSSPDNNDNEPASKNHTSKSRPRANADADLVSNNVNDNNSTLNITSDDQRISLLNNKKEKKEEKEDKKELTLFVGICHMTKLMIGSGMLSLPWAFAHVGLWPGIIAAVFCALFDFIAAMLLIYSSEITLLFEYSAILRLIGPIWESAGAITLLYVVSGSLTGYLILIGDFISDAVVQLGGKPDAIPAQRQVIIIIFTVCILTPLVLVKKLSGVLLKISSGVGLSAIIYCVLLLIITAVIHVNDPQFVLGNARNDGSIFEIMDWNIGFFIMTNVCTQAYVCHYSVQRVYRELKDRSIKRMWIVNGVSYSIVCILYIIFAICGYVLYGSACPSDVLIAFVGDVDVVIARLAMTLSVTGTYPLAFVACQATLENKLFNKKRNSIWYYDNKKGLRETVILITQAIYLILACVIPTIGPVVSINGAVSTIGLIALFPIAASWKIGFKNNIISDSDFDDTVNYMSINTTENTTKNKEHNYKFTSRSTLTKVLLSIMLGIGVVFGIMGFITEFQEVSS